jgi:4-hydroxy-3-polyprenylbenzoate decarboxylase
MSSSKISAASDATNRILSRRQVLTSGMALAASPAALGAANSSTLVAASGTALRNAPTAPFDSLRDYIAALDAAGALLKLDGVDQDTYEATAIMYQLVDEFGLRNAPAIALENITIDGRVVKGPLVANIQGPMLTEALLLGTPVDPKDPMETYRSATAKVLADLEASEGNWPLIDPVEIDSAAAPCKEIVVTGDDVDVSQFAFIKGNPGDGGRYINTASVFTRDPDMGVNLGTYRCQLKGPRKIMINFEDGQTGIKMVQAALKRGETSMKVTLVVGQDPITWMVSSSRIPSRIRNRDPIDELAVAGGLRGKAIEVVRTEDGHFQVPAHAEMVIEGTVDLINLEPEGPYHEMYGYLGHPKDKNYVMTVNTMTHRRDPWVINSFTGVVQEYISAPQRAENIYRLRLSSPQVVDYYSPHDSQGIVHISIKKDAPGQALKIAKPTAMFNPLARIVIVVDDDIDVQDTAAVRFAMGSRWQPSLATEIIENRRAFPLDPASPDRKTTSKIIIDATRQWPEEGGPAVYQQLNRTVFEAAAPDAIANVIEKWPQLVKG